MPRVLVAEEISDAGIKAMREAGLDVDVELALTHEDLLGRIAAYEGLIVRSATKVTADVIDAGTALQVVGRAGVGVDNVDVEAATRRGILVANAPQSNVISAAEHTMALILAMARNVAQGHASLSAGKWERSKLEGIELHDKTLGVIGLGRIGTLVTQRCLAFGMRVIATDPYVSEQRAAQLGIKLGSIDDVLREADIITVHVPGNASTKDLLDKETLAKCKPGVRIVNVSRGGIVNEQDLADAISSGHVAGAAIDVFVVEPATSSPLFGLPGVVVTPHLGASTLEAKDKAGTSIAEQVLLALRGEFVPYAVNMQAGSSLPEWVRGYLALAQKLGRLTSALAAEKAGGIEVSFYGKLANEDTRVLTLSVLRGFLEPTTHEPVTFINAPLMAADRGLEYSERRSNSPCEYSSLIRVTAKRGGTEDVTVAGTLAGTKDEPRLVEVDSRQIEITLAPFMAFYRYVDKPGVIHRLTGPLAEAGVNIRNMVVSEAPDGSDEAVVAIAVSAPIPPGVFDKALKAAGIEAGRFVSL